MHNLEIKDKSIYLDGFMMKGVMGYKLEEEAGKVPVLSLTMAVDRTGIAPPTIGRELDSAGYISSTLAGEVVEPLREIIREELAAHEERLKGEPVVIALSEEKKRALADYLKLNPTI